MHVPSELRDGLLEFVVFEFSRTHLRARLLVRGDDEGVLSGLQSHDSTRRAAGDCHPQEQRHHPTKRHGRPRQEARGEAGTPWQYQTTLTDNPRRTSQLGAVAAQPSSNFAPVTFARSRASSPRRVYATRWTPPWKAVPGWSGCSTPGPIIPDIPWEAR